ncbi:MAG TPA: hypothetical protein VIT67_17120 [Povalibacter sp.]
MLIAPCAHDTSDERATLRRDLAWFNTRCSTHGALVDQERAVSMALAIAHSNVSACRTIAIECLRQSQTAMSAHDGRLTVYKACRETSPCRFVRERATTHADDASLSLITICDLRDLADHGKSGLYCVAIEDVHWIRPALQ